MIAPQPPGAAEIGNMLERDQRASGPAFHGRDRASTEALVRRLHAVRRSFGITRLGSLSRLDRAGVEVAQVVRPLALSNAVAQGKGISLVEAAASALMEALESWAAERIAPGRVRHARARQLGHDIRDLYAGCLVHGFDAGWDQLRFGWVDGWDLFSGRILPVPLPLVDTVYTFPSPHPIGFPRTTSGLAAGPTMLAAILHAGLELLERAGIATARRYPRSFPERRIDPATVGGPLAGAMLSRLRLADLAAGIWVAHADHDLPVVRCQVIETEGHREIAPMPGEGFACDFTHDRAVAAALMEAAQARVTALAGAREDITRESYPGRFDRELLDARRQTLLMAGAGLPLPASIDPPASGAAALHAVLKALERAGARAAVAVPLHGGREPDLQIVRLVAPPLLDLAHE